MPAPCRPKQMLETPCALFVALLTLLCLTQCATPPKPKKPNEQCICGPLQDLDQKPFCAIWAPASRTDKPQPALKAIAQASCLPTDCSRLFSDSCEKMQMAPAPVASAPGNMNQSCFCDSLLIENDKGQVQNYCAAWAEGASHVLEYYSVETCTPQRCAEAPFVKAPKVCKQGFRAFYGSKQIRN